MINHALLLIPNSATEFLAIPVTNFPILPVGSDVSIYLTETVFLEDARIVEYSVSSTRGVEIELNMRSRNSNWTDYDIDKRWKAIAAVCVEDRGHLVDLIYPAVIDFNVKYEGKL
ncbi:MAG: hypothetical protein JWM46_417 [Candidatus Kaiserbacteria bacterium]|nr:hypothetical protein [Candidatus Kaiserbacteria bacterium]